MAEINVYVDPDASGGGTGVDWTNAYNSINAAEAGEETDLVTDTDNIIFNCRSGSGSVDSSNFQIAGWTTSTTYDIRFLGDADSGAWDTSAYRMESDGSLIAIQEYDVHFEKMQFYCTNTSSSSRSLLSYGAGSGAIGTHSIKNCILRFNSSGANSRLAISVSSSGDSGSTVLIENSIIYGGVGANTYGIIHNSDSDYTLTATNNTIYAMGYGIDASRTLTAKNNLIFNCVDDFNGVGITATYCASDDSQAGTGNFQITQTASDYAALVTDAAGGDFSVTDSSSELYNAGTNTGAPSDDIIGTSRPQATTTDIGAFELVVGAGSGRPLPQRVLTGCFGGCLNGVF